MKDSGIAERRPRGEGRHFVTCRICLRSYQSINRSHLVYKHRFDPEHPVTEYRRRFDGAEDRCRDSLRRLKRGLRSHFERLGRRWTRARVKREILRRRRRGEALNCAAVVKERQDLVMAATHRFGSWEAAINACGLRYREIRLLRTWSRREVAAAIRDLVRRGEGLNHASVRRRHPALLQAGRTRFGDWGVALRSAGVDPDEVRKHRRWSAPRVLRAIRELPGPMLVEEAQRLDSGLLQAALKRFGSWEGALRRAGLAYPEVYRPKKWTKERILEAVRRRSKGGESVASGAVEETLPGLWEAGCREFGSWPKAVALAGVAYPRREWSWKWPRERVLGVIRERVRRGASLSRGIVERAERGLVDAARRGFGSWAAALKAAASRTDGRGGGGPNEP